MGFVHMSVNSTSRVYLQNERRYNYTTPKSFLEQISLYSKLLRQKSSELTGKVARLENGLDKLRSTAEQVKYKNLIFSDILFYYWLINHILM
jgi:dynein heavy chain